MCLVSLARAFTKQTGFPLQVKNRRNSNSLSGNTKKIRKLAQNIVTLLYPGSPQKNLFPVQQVAVIVASQTAASLFVFSIFCCCLVGKYCPILLVEKRLQKCKRKSPVTPFFRHPAVPPETEFLFSLAPGSGFPYSETKGYCFFFWKYQMSQTQFAPEEE